MHWMFNQEDLQQLTENQLVCQRYALARHLLTLADPPQDWHTCEALLIKQCQLAAEYDIHRTECLKMFVEALHYMPDALEYKTVKNYLSSGGLERFRVERVLEWAIQQKECKNGLSGKL